MTCAPWRGVIPAALVLANVLALALLPDTLAAAPGRVTVRWTTNSSDAQPAAVEVLGLKPSTLEALRQTNWTSAQWQRVLTVHAEQGDLMTDIGLPAMLGVYSVQREALCFVPQFPLQPGLPYRATFHPDSLPGEGGSRPEAITTAFRAPPQSASATTMVSRVYPSSEVLPENLLKFYVHFSAPMSRGHIYDHIHLRDAAGKEIELPFLELDEELWNPAMTRLTLFIDPGRIKRGVRPLEEIGPALEEGKRFTLVIDRAWQDGAGRPLRETFQKNFRVGPPDREPPDPARWKIQPPKSGTRDALTIAFPKPMDHALAERVILVTSASSEIVEGVTKLDDEERRWTFLPNQPWPRGPFKLVIQTTIEDLAGNNIGKPFEVDLFEGVQRRLARSTVNLPFEVR